MQYKTTRGKKSSLKSMQYGTRHRPIPGVPQYDNCIKMHATGEPFFRRERRQQGSGETGERRGGGETEKDEEEREVKSTDTLTRPLSDLSKKLHHLRQKQRPAIVLGFPAH